MGQSAVILWMWVPVHDENLALSGSYRTDLGRVLVIIFLLGFAYPKGCSNLASAERSEAVSLDIQI